MKSIVQDLVIHSRVNENGMIMVNSHATLKGRVFVVPYSHVSIIHHQLSMSRK